MSSAIGVEDKVEGCCKANMGSWKSRSFSPQRPSETPGKDKNGCTASALDRYIARRNRSHKHPKYQQWCDAKTGGKGSRSVS